MKSSGSAKATWRQGVTWRIVRCVLLYLLVYAMAWTAIGLLAPRGTTASFEQLSRWGSSLSYLDTGVYCFVLIGLPSIFIIVLTGLSHHEMEPPKFRAMVTVLILLPTWFLLFGNIVEELVIQVAAQGVFTTFVMPVPLIPRRDSGP
ncbi:hypothetical protein ACFY41_03990 [Streptomyces syringium]|uniref:hypothetical protein n=1 Tax=Streptomyces syringium TaxID=76729 RepID=UPI00367FBF04